MSIGAGIALIVIGAIIAFGVNVDIEWVNLDIIGYILIAAGVVVFIIGIVLTAKHRKSETITRTEIDPATNQRVTRHQTNTTDDEAPY